MEEIEIVYTDLHCLVVNKPAGLLSVPGKSSQPNLLETLRIRFPNIRLVHRLDMATSGLMVFALDHPAQKSLSAQFESRTVKKVYHAVVTGSVAVDWGEVSLPLACDWPNRPRQHVSWNHGKPALTRYQVVYRTGTTTSLVLYPVTGRSHQLRVHCLAIGHPIEGDCFYGGAPDNARLKLHASTLDFLHPVSRQRVSFRSHVPFALD